MNIRHHLWEEQWKRICCPLGRWRGWASDKNFSERGVWHYNNLRCWPRASECAAARWARHVTGNTPAPAALSAPTLVAPAPPGPRLEVATALSRPFISAGPHVLAPRFTPPPGKLTGSTSQRPAITCWWHLCCMPRRTEVSRCPALVRQVQQVPFGSAVTRLPPSAHTQTCRRAHTDPR